MTEKAFDGSSVQRVDVDVDGTHALLVKLVGGGAGAGAGTGTSTSTSGGVIPGVDTAGTKWMMVVNSIATPATITYIKVSDGTTGTPVGGFTPDADQNGLTDAQLRASAVPVANQKGVPATLTQTIVSLAANTATQLVAANTSRQYLAIQVIGTTGINLGFGSAPTVGNGWAIDPASSTGRQGGSVTWDAGVITQQQVQAIASAATTVVVIEGI